MKKKRRILPGPLISARTFQHQLGLLAETVALKVEREGVKVTKPPFTAADITVMLRHSLACYGLMCLCRRNQKRRGLATGTFCRTPCGQSFDD